MFGGTMKKIFLTCTVLAFLALAACAPKPTRPDQAIETSPGKNFQILIGANPTTGYHWEIVGELDKSVIEFVSKEYQSTSQPGSLAGGSVGGGGMDVWTFKAVAAGQAKITLGSYPPSNTANDPTETETFSISVK
jgi:predicted secreted protein